ncbi:MAG: PASTA domain-containing protein [Gemmatimonadota bacterium]|nr:PASTA domain-containing protein [Gemmatimonadota bacterium]
MRITTTPRKPGHRAAGGRTLASQRRRIILAWIGAAVLLGYLASMLMFPAPLVSRETPVALVIGLPVATAEERLEAQGFRPKTEDRESDPAVPAEHVLWQDPPGGVELESGTVVRLTISDGPASTQIPDLSDYEFEPAVRVLRAGGFQIGIVDSVAAGQPAGVVISTRPPVGSSRPSGTAVDLVVSRGPANIRVPNVVGLDRVAARSLLENSGLRVGAIETRTSRQLRPGQVIEQRPAAGTLSPAEASIHLIIVRPEGQ